ncbi:hypothetical protein [Microcella frigidaquae]|uniref:Uncharacterized protein n=1 Tax=Microcella frigidaquae TaxID=424758 RepID=A0A840XIZ3_9MICO|nr:hypothetical protein [Microcella frigidaquae]MBB5618442.1 hypothetical protein [Microcella frigidaquae]NHN44656.1 hypothetical protein [Microcella frigidaquae]
MSTTVRVLAAPDWADPVASEVYVRTFHDDPELDEYEERLTVWRSADASPNPAAVARLECTDTRRSIEPRFELGTTAGTLSLSATSLELIYVPTAADARALAEAATALAALLDDLERRPRA